jgi:hypothetical protein
VSAPACLCVQEGIKGKEGSSHREPAPCTWLDWKATSGEGIVGE